MGRPIHSLKTWFLSDVTDQSTNQIRQGATCRPVVLRQRILPRYCVFKTCEICMFDTPVLGQVLSDFVRVKSNVYFYISTGNFDRTTPLIRSATLEWLRDLFSAIDHWFLLDEVMRVFDHYEKTICVYDSDNVITLLLYCGALLGILFSSRIPILHKRYIFFFTNQLIPSPLLKCDPYFPKS